MTPKWNLVDRWVAGRGAPHVHDHHHEFFWVLDGVMTVHDGDREFEVAPGGLVAAWRGAPQMFGAGTDPGRGRFPGERAMISSRRRPVLPTRRTPPRHIPNRC